MRNVTITLDDETARWARVEAAKRDTSVSRFVGDLLRQHMEGLDSYERAHRSYAGRHASELMARPGPYPRREDLYDR